MRITLLDWMVTTILTAVIPLARAQHAPELRGPEPGSGDQAPALDAAEGAMSRHMIDLANGGAIWISQSQRAGTPRLTVRAPTQAMLTSDGGLAPLEFQARCNYPHFVDKAQIRIYRGTDKRLSDPLAVLDMPVGEAMQARWSLPAGQALSLDAGDELRYVLRVYGAGGAFDETLPQRLPLAASGTHAPPLSLPGGLQDQVALHSSEESALPPLVEDERLAPRLRQQAIAINGAQVRVQGQDLPEGAVPWIDGQPYPVDRRGEFVAEFLLPPGRHEFQVELRTADGATLARTLDAEVAQTYLTGVALADITVSQNRISGSNASLRDDPRYDDPVWRDGRLAFYLRGLVGGRYRVTAQADTTEQDLGNLFGGFGQADPQDIFRRLDPDLYYPTYGDDSAVYRDVDTMGRFYLRVDWDRGQALWGNYNVGFGDTQYAQYLRALYGAALDWRSATSNRWGDAVTELRAFGSQAQTAPGHSEFLGTGGSLYYLKHADILPGSETVVVEVRDPTTGRVEQRVPLQRDRDYEIDDFQGRLLLRAPLAQIARQNAMTLTRDVALDGYEQRLIVDYEWIPNGLDADEVSAGVRARHWISDHLAVGGTYVNEGRSGEGYSLAGVDLTMRAGEGSYVKMEYSQTHATSVPAFYSDNGGLSFEQLNPDTDPASREGTAQSVEARLDLKELKWTQRDWNLAGWWRQVSEGYSIARLDTGQAIEEYGAEVLGHPTDALTLYARQTIARRGEESLGQTQLTGEWALDDTRRLGAELRQVRERRVDGDGLNETAGTLAALRYSQRLGERLDVYGIAQHTVDDDAGRYERNNAYTVGGRYEFDNRSSVGAEATTGDRGNAVQVNGEYRLTPSYSLNGSYTYSSDRQPRDELFNPSGAGGWTLGQHWEASDRLTVFNENQYLKNDDASGFTQTVGANYQAWQGITLSATLQGGQLRRDVGGPIDRNAISIGIGDERPAGNWSSRLEWRRDRGAEQREQWVSINSVLWRVNEDWRLAGRLNLSDTDDRLDAAAGARFVESNIGFAYRPVRNQRWGLFGRYTYLYDLSALGQLNGNPYDQRSRILSLEGVYMPRPRWELALKLAQREGQARLGRGSGAWFDSSARLLAGQVRYDLFQQWHALLEHRSLDVEDGGVRSGWLVGVDRDIGANFRVGIGYNMTDFSDDLTDLDYRRRGWFFNVSGRY